MHCPQPPGFCTKVVAEKSGVVTIFKPKVKIFKPGRVGRTPGFGSCQAKTLAGKGRMDHKSLSLDNEYRMFSYRKTKNSIPHLYKTPVSENNGQSANRPTD
jgi:hypothetical protein